MDSFDLLKQPWVPVIRGSSKTQVNLRDVLLQAHDISEISDPLPIVEYGLYRFLVALVLDIFEVNNARGLERLLDAGRFDPGRIEAYFDQWGERFDLFHPRYPFLQTPGMADSPDKPLAGLLPSVPSGTNANHFHHRAEHEFGVSPAAAARLLTSLAPFMTAGGAGLSPSINGAPPWYVLINGEDLFHTICLNCPVMLGKEMGGKAPVAWRNDLPPTSDKRCTEASLLEALTWRPRQVRLIPGGPGVCSISGEESPTLVTSMKFKAGASCDFTWFDPSVPYRITDRGPLVIRPDEGKEIWRDTGPLALLNNRSYESADAKIKFTRPTLVDQFAILVRDDYIDSDTELRLTAYGMRTDLKMKVFEWRKERLKTPVKLVMNKTFQLRAQEAIEEADSVEYAVAKSIKQLYPRDGKSNSKALATVITTAQREYWRDLREPYQAMLRKLAAVDKDRREVEGLSICSEWREDVKQTATDVFENAAKDMDSDSDAIRRLVEARRSLEVTLWKKFNSQDTNNNIKGGQDQ